jgi:hypothetical protein
MKRKEQSYDDIRKWYRYQFFGTATVAIPREETAFNATIANISVSGLGLYSTTPVGKGKNVKVTISFVDKKGKVREAFTTGKVDWQKKFLNMYLLGINFDEELNMNNQPHLLDHLTWLIDTYRWPQPYKDKRIAML